MKVIFAVINTTKVVLKTEKTEKKNRFRPVQDLNP